EAGIVPEEVTELITAKWRIGVAQGLFIALLLTLFTGATYADTPKRGGILYIGQDFGPQSLDAHKTTAWASVNIFELVYDTLLRWDSEMKLEPSLARSWTVSDDGLT